MLPRLLLLGLIGSFVGYSLLDNLSGVALPQVPGGVQQAPQSMLTGAGIAALLVPFIDGSLGGAWGAKTGRRRP